MEHIPNNPDKQLADQVKEWAEQKPGPAAQKSPEQSLEEAVEAWKKGPDRQKNKHQPKNEPDDLDRFPIRAKIGEFSQDPAVTRQASFSSKDINQDLDSIKPVLGEEKANELKDFAKQDIENISQPKNINQELEAIESLPQTTERFRISKTFSYFKFIEKGLQKGDSENLAAISKAIDDMEQSKPKQVMSAWYNLNRNKTLSRVAEYMALNIDKDKNITTKSIAEFIDGHLGPGNYSTKTMNIIAQRLGIIFGLDKSQSRNVKAFTSFLSGYTVREHALAKCARILALKGVELKAGDIKANQINDLISGIKNQRLVRSSLNDIKTIFSGQSEERNIEIAQIINGLKLRGVQSQEALDAIMQIAKQDPSQKQTEPESIPEQLLTTCRSLKVLIEKELKGMTDEEIKDQGLTIFQNFAAQCKTDEDLTKFIAENYQKLISAANKVAPNIKPEIENNDKAGETKKAENNTTKGSFGKIAKEFKEIASAIPGIAGWSFLMFLITVLLGSTWAVKELSGGKVKV